ncbi:hypothetical protein MNEG_3361 [Monoraphidium neglectum]|uniref:Uncharacterized protein n=1 Tax=Monoraphidium neglectum TaxID=145388 RepID=A0A0D2NI04_9CHLO|nr:hypothetical protein MNEG_3361 [Monoraphidium neglectum]KIZ04596.1 hypothetical protein MNEG_3361 [Monoraphidium neglectum]|eukprot:XP_013903615.1 hypothetical protein MNEG_3361 [Monoraphidium neglectum]
MVGKRVQVAKLAIKSERPDLIVQVVPPDSAVTMEFRDDRVRLYADYQAIVTKVPIIG